MTESPQTQSEISIHQLVVGKPANDGNIPAQCELLRCSLQEGMDILLWRGHFARPETLQLHDDLGRINFSCILEGTSRFAIQGLRRHTDWELARNRHCCCQQQRCNAETHLTAQALRHALMRMHGGFSHEQKPSTLWLQGQSLVMLSLVLDEHREDASCLSCHFNPMERQKLLRAKDLLLADLTQAPGVAELARESGLSVLKIKRGFRVLFNNSVYGLFQAERMQEARRRLANGNTSVMTVAADLGYANASHFSAAFQKQFGVTPSTFKRGM